MNPGELCSRLGTEDKGHLWTLIQAHAFDKDTGGICNAGHVIKHRARASDHSTVINTRRDPILLARLTR